MLRETEATRRRPTLRCRAAQEVLLKMLAHSCRVEPDELLELKRQFDVGTWLNLLAQRYERRA